MRKSKTFYNIFIPVLILSLGLVISFGSYIYVSTTNSVVDRISDSQQSLISQIRNTLEQKIQTIEYAFNTYSTTKSFTDVINNPLTEQEFQTYQEVNSQLNYIASLGLDGVQYSLISLKQDWSITNGSLSRLTDEEKSELYNKYISEKSEDLFWVKTEDGIQFVHTLPVFSNNKQAIALSSISLKTLNNTLQSQPDTPVYILNKQGELLYSADTEHPQLSDVQIKQIMDAASSRPQTGKLTIPGDTQAEVNVIYAKSSYNNWTFVTLLDDKAVSEAMSATRIGIVVMGLIIMILIFIIAYFLSVYLSKPIRKIQRSLAHSSEPMMKDEVDWIIRSIDSIVSEKESLEHLMEAEKPKLETQFVLNLLHNRLTSDEAWRSMSRFGYRVQEDKVYVTMLVQMDRYHDKQLSDKDVLLLAVNNLVQDIVPQGGRLLPVVMNERTQATILMFEGDSEQEIRKKIIAYAKQIIRSSREYLRLPVSIGVSQSYTDLLKSREACEMSIEALHQRLNLGKESIIFFDDISTVISGPMVLHYPAELETQLFDAIRLGDESAVLRALYPLLADMMKHSKNPMNLEVTLMRFVNNLIQLEQHIGAEVLLTPDNANLYHRLLNIRNPEEIERILVDEVILPMVKCMKEKTNHQFRSIADRIASIIRAEYDQELSLESISERLHYSPNYLSSIFKKEYGMTFTEFLMNYRLDIARKWLVDTDMTIKDIAERLQYQNPQNFIRSFRKKEHVTPGAYRKMKLQA
ncbi:AraC family transcriptional regulator [Paenibacillus shunpengii]|uniref:AraC family transcriptional regulator n=1 Tax=Paenibacillus shunpengii TaxID=2054424 RepID=A0ABW5SPG0_9BACL|nr:MULTISPECIES: AraC family transcriptional regulator [unclassified Paenibacillus]OMC67306.1 AraC family transcriptional regulator [Paenibacillus sp. FSL H7-0326]SDW70158.1 transcriptional regulator, AraC family [Paenibacillus sp. PDC88]